MLLVRRPRVIAARKVLEARRVALVDDVAAGRIERILALRFARLGDVVFTTPALRVLANALPDARIDYCTSRACAPLVAHHPTVSEVLTFDPGPHHPTYLLRRRGLGREIARRRYDLAVIFESDHPTRYMLEHLCRTAGVRHVVSRSSYVGEKLSTGGAGHSCDKHMKLLSMLGLAPDDRSYDLFYSAADAGRSRALSERPAGASALRRRLGRAPRPPVSWAFSPAVTTPGGRARACFWACATSSTRPGRSSAGRSWGDSSAPSSMRESS